MYEVPQQIHAAKRYLASRYKDNRVSRRFNPTLSILQVLSPFQRSVHVILVVSEFLPG